MANVLVWAVWVLAAFACLGTGIAVISFSNPFFSALALIGNLGSLAVMYLLLSAEFVAAAQVLVYAGAVIVMFLFVFIWLRATLPRLRYDQLMRFGWKVLLPVATVNALITALLVVAV